jgi:hypothetical protein
MQHFFSMCMVFQKKLYDDIPSVIVWRVLRKRLHLKVYKLSIVQGVEQWIVCTPLSFFNSLLAIRITLDSVN